MNLYEYKASLRVPMAKLAGNRAVGIHHIRRRFIILEIHKSLYMTVHVGKGIFHHRAVWPHIGAGRVKASS